MENGVHKHKHVHTQEEQQAVLNRLAKAIGHMESVRRMVQDGRDCSEVLIQLAAVKAAINSTGKVIIKNHLEQCIVEAVAHGDMDSIEELNRSIDRFI